MWLTTKISPELDLAQRLENAIYECYIENDVFGHTPIYLVHGQDSRGCICLIYAHNLCSIYNNQQPSIYTQ